MLDLIRKMWPLQRTLVSDGYDQALRIIADRYPVKTESFRSGTKCWDWTVPPKWECSEAYIARLNGERVIDVKDNLLHCAEYCAPIDRIVSRDELFKHLYTHARNPKAVPYAFKFYERDWAFCCSQNQKAKLKDARYRVVVKSSFSSGALKAGVWHLPGRTRKNFILTAHLCHTLSANDDLSGVAVGLEVMRSLAKRRNRHYSYTLLLVPETIGTIAWLSAHEDKIADIKAGLFLEMLGNDHAFALQKSYQGDSTIDSCCRYVLAQQDKRHYCGDFWTVIRNDEMEFNSAGLRIPMPSLSRCHRPGSRSWPYPEYHTDLDTPDIIHDGRLKQAVDVVLNILECFDKSVYPRALFKGQVCCSAHGIFPKDPQKYNAFFRTMFELDGKHSLIDIAVKHSLALREVQDVVDILRKHRLVKVARG